MVLGKKHPDVFMSMTNLDYHSTTQARTQRLGPQINRIEVRTPSGLNYYNGTQEQKKKII
jgi:hypothetical protein